MEKPLAPSNYSAVIRSTQRLIYKIHYLINHLSSDSLFSHPVFFFFFLKRVFILMFALFEEEQIVSTEGLFGWSLSYASDTDASFFLAVNSPR